MGSSPSAIKPTSAHPTSQSESSGTTTNRPPTAGSVRQTPGLPLSPSGPSLLLAFVSPSSLSWPPPRRCPEQPSPARHSPDIRRLSFAHPSNHSGAGGAAASQPASDQLASALRAAAARAVARSACAAALRRPCAGAPGLGQACRRPGAAWPARARQPAVLAQPASAASRHPASAARRRRAFVVSLRHRRGRLVVSGATTNRRTPLRPCRPSSSSLPCRRRPPPFIGAVSARRRRACQRQRRLRRRHRQRQPASQPAPAPASIAASRTPSHRPSSLHHHRPCAVVRADASRQPAYGQRQRARRAPPS